MSSWRAVSKSSPCPICGKLDWCAWTPDGTRVRCMRAGEAPPGFSLLSNDRDGGHIFAAEDLGTQPPQARDGNRNGDVRRRCHTDTKVVDLEAQWATMRDQLTEIHLEELATSTRLPVEAWKLLDPGWATAEDLRALRAGGARWKEDFPDGAWSFAERNGHGRIVGFSFRAKDGRKGAPSGTVGASRGLVIPSKLPGLPDPVLVVEGASDVVACTLVGIAAVGRPNNSAGAADLASLLDGRDVIVVGERDQKATGQWPGRDGAKSVAGRLAQQWGSQVRWSLPPEGFKDMRDWICSLLPSDRGDSAPEVLANKRDDVLRHLESSARTVKPERRRVADTIVDLAIQRFRFGRTPDGELFLVDHTRGPIAVPFRSSGSSLQSILAHLYRDQTGRTAGTSAVRDAILTLEGIAARCEPEELAIRVAASVNTAEAFYPQALFLDLGTDDGRVVEITSGGWWLRETAPMLFRRTALTAPCPIPAPIDEGDIMALRSILNVTDASWPLLVGWLVAAHFPGIAHPILVVAGEKGTGKSTMARFIASLVDPSTAALRSQPTSEKDWAVVASGSWIVPIDNVSKIPSWWSDALCKAVTGDGFVDRRLYTDSGLSVLTFRRSIIITCIDPGFIRGDLGDRFLVVELEPIGEGSRRSELEIERRFTETRPLLQSGLLNLVSLVLKNLPTACPANLPRMADFAIILETLDRHAQDVLGRSALGLYTGQRAELSADIVEGNPLAHAIVQFMETRIQWTGTATELLKEIRQIDSDNEQWLPRNATSLGKRLASVTSDLRTVGIFFTRSKASQSSTSSRLIQIEKKRSQPVRPVPPVPDADSGPDMHDSVRTGQDRSGAERYTSEEQASGATMTGRTGSALSRTGSDRLQRQPVRDESVDCRAVRRAVAAVIRTVRRSDPAEARSLREAFRERVALCTVEGGLGESEAHCIAYRDLQAALAPSATAAYCPTPATGRDRSETLGSQGPQP